MYPILMVVVVIAGVILYQAVDIAIVNGDKWKVEGQNPHFKRKKIEAGRGNIYARDGSLLATSLPFFDISFDPNSTGMRKGDFEANIDSLAFCLATYVDSKYTPGGYKEMLEQKRKDGRKSVPIIRGADLMLKNKISRFPLFRKGQFEGGLIVETRYKRRRPYGILAHRTIGYVRENAKPVGLEGYFDDVLKGKEGEQLMYKVRGDTWIPVEDLAAIEPVNGSDLVTTLDVDLQEITETALMRAVKLHEAAWGTAILMDVKTGAIRAIANLDRDKETGKVWEEFNHAIGSRVEPGSTFKLATMLSLLEDGKVDLNDTVDIEKGEKVFMDKKKIKDSHKHTFSKIPVRMAFEISSNVGMAKLAYESYGSRKNKRNGFIRNLRRFNLDKPTGIAIKGEKIPILKSPDDSLWNGNTVPWMAMGYEVSLTPLQLLTFYNTVANGGKMMKPFLVSEIQRYGKTEEYFKPTVIKSQIASKSNIRKVQSLLRGVVLRGTAKRLNTDKYTFAGKTGTTQLRDRKHRLVGHQASFYGYFPAEKPKYSLAVVIYKPKGGYYGSDVALPVFREIADKIFSARTEMNKPIEKYKKWAMGENVLPQYDVGKKEDFKALFSSINIPHREEGKSKWGVVKVASKDTFDLQPRLIRKNLVPNVVGMGLRDALYLLENKKLKVKVNGYGKVKKQSIKPGTRVRGQTIWLQLG